MTSVQKPPQQPSERTSRILLRFLVLIVLLLALAMAVWSATTRTLITATEDETFESVGVETRQVVAGTAVNIVSEGSGPVPVILLNGFDIAGGVVWDGVVSELDGYRTVRLDLPGYGMSDRIREPGPGHTVASMAQVVAAYIEEDVLVPPVVVGVGLGGEVAAEIAVTKPELLRGMVLIDVDFWEARSWLRIVERLPFVGDAVTFTFETGGRLADEQWAPWCGEGGWCPSSAQSEARVVASSIVGSTDSIRAFLRTRPASLVPSDLDEIEVPTVLLWSEKGSVPRDSVDRILDEVTIDVELITGDVYQIHLETPGTVADAVESLVG